MPSSYYEYAYLLWHGLIDTPLQYDVVVLVLLSYEPLAASSRAPATLAPSSPQPNAT